MKSALPPIWYALYPTLNRVAYKQVTPNLYKLIESKVDTPVDELVRIQLSDQILWHLYDFEDSFLMED